MNPLKIAARIWAALTKKPDQQFAEAQRLARQATRDFKRRQRLRLRSIRFWD